MTSTKKNKINTHENCVCPNDECGRTFDRPLQLTVLSSDPVETYPACPYCMSKIEADEEKQKLTKEVPLNLKINTALQNEQEKEREENKDTSTQECQHEFGYLKKRPKGTSVPDECLVCPKMIQCLA